MLQTMICWLFKGNPTAFLTLWVTGRTSIPRHVLRADAQLRVVGDGGPVRLKTAEEVLLAVFSTHISRYEV